MIPKAERESVGWTFLLLGIILVTFRFGYETVREARFVPDIGGLPQFALTNQHAIRVSDQDLKGYVCIYNIIFTRCPGQCHRLSQAMSKLQGELPLQLPVRFVSITADPEYDTPEALEQYGQRYGAYPGRWLFLTGTKSDLYSFATNGLRFSVVETHPARARNLDELFIHSSAFVVVDGNSRLRAYVQAEDKDAIPRIVRMVKEICRE